jgi:hypothetical protein
MSPSNAYAFGGKWRHCGEPTLSTMTVSLGSIVGAKNSSVQAVKLSPLFGAWMAHGVVQS